MKKEILRSKTFESKNVFITTKIKKIDSWTKEEDELLIKLAQKYNFRQWRKVAEHFTKRTSIQCSARYKRIRPGIVKGAWTKAEDTVLLDLIDRYGKNWSLISKYIPSRTGKQIRDRYLNSLDSNLNKDKFSEQEDKRLIELYLQYGTQWSNIAKLFERRTGDMVKNRFYSTLRKQVHDKLPSRSKKNKKAALVKRKKNRGRNKIVISKIENCHNDVSVTEINKINCLNDKINEKTSINSQTAETNISKFSLGCCQGGSSFVPYVLNETKETNHATNDVRVIDEIKEHAKPPQAEVNILDYILKLKQIENSMNSSFNNYLDMTNQFQMMSALCELYGNVFNVNMNQNLGFRGNGN